MFEEHNEFKKHLIEKLNKLYNLFKDGNILADLEKISKLIKIVEEDNIIITVIGEFNRGKSTLLNVMIQEDILPTGILPTTTTINMIKYGENRKILIHQRNNEIIEVPVDKEYLLEYSGKQNNNLINFVEVFLPFEFLKNGIILVDTPGVNDINEQRMEVTYQYLPNSDIVLFVLDATTPLKKTEAEFLKEHVLSSNLENIVFLINRIDLLDDEEIVESVDSVLMTIKKLFPNLKIEKNIFAISSKNELNSILTNHNYTKKFNDFNKYLDSFIKSKKKIEIKNNRLTYQYNSLLESLYSSLDFKENILNKNETELNAINNQLLLKETELKNNLMNLLDYIDDNFTQTMQKIEVSLLNKSSNLEEYFMFQIDKNKTDLTDYVEKEIPYTIRQGIKQWVEQSKGQIDQQLSLLFNKSIEGFEKYFSKKPIINSLILPSNNNIGINSINIPLNRKNISEDISKKTFAAGAITIGLITTVFSGGLLPIIFGAIGGGNIAQRFFGQNLLKKEIEIQKVELRSKLPNLLNEIFKSIYENLKNEILLKVNDFKKQLIQEFDANLEMIKFDINEVVNKNKMDQEKLAIEQKKIYNIKQNLELLK